MIRTADIDVDWNAAQQSVAALSYCCNDGSAKYGWFAPHQRRHGRVTAISKTPHDIEGEPEQLWMTCHCTGLHNDTVWFHKRSLHPNYKKNPKKHTVSSHADSFGFVHWGFDIPASRPRCQQLSLETEKITVDSFLCALSRVMSARVCGKIFCSWIINT